MSSAFAYLLDILVLFAYHPDPFAWVSVTLLFAPHLYCRSAPCSPQWEAPLGRTVPSWRIIVEQEIGLMSRFKHFLRPEDRAVFDDLLTQCKLYAAGGEVFTSPERKMSLLFWMIFAQHRKLTELEKNASTKPRSDGRTPPDEYMCARSSQSDRCG